MHFIRCNSKVVLAKANVTASICVTLERYVEHSLDNVTWDVMTIAPEKKHVFSR